MGSDPKAPEALDGFVPPESPYSPRRAFEGLSPLVRPLVRYAPEDPWERDTNRLPRPLREYRRRMRAFAEEHVAPLAARADLFPHAPAGATHPELRDLLGVAGRAGLFSDLLPRPFGSMDPALLRYPLFLPQALRTEELARVDGGLMLLLCASQLGVAPLVLSGDLRILRRTVLPAFRASEAGEPHLFAYAITEPQSGSDVEESHGAREARPGTVARRTPGGYVLTGRKCYISGGDVAQTLVVFAALDGEGFDSWTAFVVPRSARGFRVARTELKMGMRASGAAELELDDVFVPESAVVLGLRKGWALNRATLNMSRIPVGAMGVGLARAATETATEFACRTELAGKPLVMYQEVQLALADMMAETQGARALLWQAASSTVARQGEASTVKFHCTDVARRVCEQAMDLLGNHSVLHGARIERALRDVRLTQIFEGTNQINRLAVIEDCQEQLLAVVSRLSSRKPPKRA